MCPLDDGLEVLWADEYYLYVGAGYVFTGQVKRRDDKEHRK
jgi:hypothetical protein